MAVLGNKPDRWEFFLLLLLRHVCTHSDVSMEIYSTIPVHTYIIQSSDTKV